MEKSVVGMERGDKGGEGSRMGKGDDGGREKERGENIEGKRLGLGRVFREK